MNQFEIARQKAEKRLERQTRYQAPAHVEPFSAPVEVPKESPDGIVEVTVTLPSGVHRFTLLKTNVFANAVQAKLTRQAFVNGVMSGLAPLLGVVKEK
jgi:hypothetical protein